jgi:hypothetical protein
MKKLRTSFKVVALVLLIPMLYIASTGPVLFFWDKTALGYNGKFAFESKTYPAKVLRRYWWCFQIAVLEPEDSN